MVVPFAKVTDMSSPTNAGCPCCIAVHDGIVQTDRKQDRRAVSTLPLKSSFDFIFYPTALDGMFRQDDHQLVVEPDRFIDALTESVTNLQILCGQPATNAFLT